MRLQVRLCPAYQNLWAELPQIRAVRVSDTRNMRAGGTMGQGLVRLRHADQQRRRTLYQPREFHVAASDRDNTGDLDHRRGI